MIRNGFIEISQNTWVPTKAITCFRIVHSFGYADEDLFSINCHIDNYCEDGGFCLEQFNDMEKAKIFLMELIDKINV